MKALIASTVIALLLGFSVGFVSVQPSNATTTYTIEIMGGGNAHVNCGWHGACGSTPTAGNALDWLDYSDHEVYFRVFGYRGSGSQATVAEATVELINDGWNCHAVYMNLSSPSGVTYRGSEEYLHTTTTANGNTVDIVANTTGYWTQSQFATTLQWIEPGHISPENGNCLWEGPHSHQLAYWENVSSSSRNTGYFPGYVNAEDRAIDIQGDYQDRASWAY